MIRYLDNETLLDISILEKVLFLGFYTNHQSLYHELENTLYITYYSTSSHLIHTATYVIDKKKL